VPEARVLCDARAAVTAAEAIGFPVVLKALGIAHKSEVGAVRLDLRSAAEVEVAATELQSLGDGLLVEAMVTDAVAELLIGVAREPNFGLLMTIAAGGVLVELSRDAASLLLPVTPDAIREAILSLRMASLLQGYRRRPPGDVDAAVAAALAIQRYAEANIAALEELDVNPLLVRPAGRGAVAVDALIRVREP
jgi:acyl-CoA synthetase (NDP forming)